MKLKAITMCAPKDSIESTDVIKKNVGIYKRHIAKQLTSLDMQYYAALDLFQLIQLDPSEVDCIFSVTQTPTFQGPINACLLQGLLGCRTNIMGLDSPLGCSGYTYALAVIQGLLKSKMIKNCLLLCGDTQTKLIDPNDPATNQLFADAGTATWILPSEDEVSLDCGTNGLGYKAIVIRETMALNGVAVFKFATSTIPQSIRNARPALDFDYLVLHQANKMINDTIVQRLGILPGRALSSLEQFGNTSINTIPVTLASCFENANVTGSIMMSGFGIGLSWCSIYLVNQDIKIGKINYLSEELHKDL